MHVMSDTLRSHRFSQTSVARQTFDQRNFVIGAVADG